MPVVNNQPSYPEPVADIHLRWGPGRHLIYYAGLIAAALVPPMVYALGPTWSPGFLLTAVLFVTLLHASAVAIYVAVFDFVANRRWVLIDLYLTRMDLDEIARFSLRSGIDGATTAFGLLAFVECLMAICMLPGWGVIVLFLLLPARWVVHGYLVNRVTSHRSSLGLSDPTWLLRTLLEATLVLAGFLFLVGILTALLFVVSFFVSLLLSGGNHSGTRILTVTVAACLGLPPYWVFSARKGWRMLKDSYRVAADNYRRITTR